MPATSDSGNRPFGLSRLDIHPATVVRSRRMNEEIYSGNTFSIDQAGSDWAIWRYDDDDGGREQIILTRDGMDELRDYFVQCYTEDRATASVSG